MIVALASARWSFAVLATSIVLGAEDPREEPGKNKAEPAAPAPANAGPTVKLLDAGSEPRREMRYRLKVMGPEKVVLEMKMSMGMGLAGAQPMEMKIPTTRLGMTIDKKSVLPDGKFRYEFFLDSPEIAAQESDNPLMVEGMKKALKGIERITGHSVVDARGFIIEAEVNVPPGLNPQLQQVIDNLRQSLRQMSSPLPAEPVGPGARWEVTMPVDTPAIKLTQVATYTLKEVEGDRMKLDVAIRQTAPAQDMAGPGAPPGVKVHLKSMASKGKGSMTVDLGATVPRASTTVESSSEMAIDAGGSGQQTDMKMTVKADVKVSPKESPPAEKKGQGI